MESNSEPITEEMLRKTYKKLAAIPPSVCGGTIPHIVHPNALTKPGWYTCVNCLQSVRVGERDGT